MPVWSPDGVRVAFESLRASGSGIFERVASGAGDEQPVSSQAHFPLDWSRDGRVLLWRYDEPETRGNIWVLPMARADQSRAVLNTAADEQQAQLSPSGRWLSYSSDESGRYEVYVRPFPERAGKWQVSVGGGYEPRWRSDGSELYYVSGDHKLMAVPIRAGTTFEAGPVAPLFDAPVGGYLQGWNNSNNYDVSPDGQRFLLKVPLESPVSSPIVVILNWAVKLGR